MPKQASSLRARRVAAAAACVAAILVVVAERSRVIAQQPAATAGTLETIQVRPNVYVIFGAGANITVQTGPEGAIVVDTGEAPMAEKVLAVIKALTPKPIRYIFNTSADADHVGGNDKLA